MHPNENALHDYVDGAGSPAERSTIDQHLATCASCRQLVDDLREIARAVTSLEVNSAVPAVPVAERTKPAKPRAKPALVATPADRWTAAWQRPSWRPSCRRSDESRAVPRSRRHPYRRRTRAHRRTGAGEGRRRVVRHLRHRPARVHGRPDRDTGRAAPSKRLASEVSTPSRITMRPPHLGSRVVVVLEAKFRKRILWLRADWRRVDWRLHKSSTSFLRRAVCSFER